VALIVGLLGFVPAPYRTIVEGVVFAPEEATVYAGEPGLVGEVLATPNRPVVVGEPILRLSDPYAETRLVAADADARKFRFRFEQSLNVGAYETRFWSAQAARAESEADILRNRIALLEVRAPRDGTLVVPRPADLEGRFLQRGDVVGYVVEPEDLVVRIAVPQDQADLIRRRSIGIEMRSADRLSELSGGRVVREVPSVGTELPSMALATEGGGPFSLDPASEGGPTSLEPVMLFDIAPTGAPPSLALGMRVYVRVDHGPEPIANRVYRRIRQVFLKRLNV